MQDKETWEEEIKFLNKISRASSSSQVNNTFGYVDDEFEPLASPYLVIIKFINHNLGEYEISDVIYQIASAKEMG